MMSFFFFFQAEDGIRDGRVTGVQTCALPISEMLSRAIRNLVENAINHSPPGTTAEIVLEDSGMVRVLDEGPGIKEEERELMFQRFWRRDRRRTGGAGLGLSIVQRIADAHAATISVDNRPTGGATFSLGFVRVG